MQRPGRSDRVGQANSNDVSGARRIRRNPSGGRSAETRMNADAKSVDESVFGQESGRIIATLIRISGSFDRAEEAMQEAFASALASWPKKEFLKIPQPGLPPPRTEADRSKPPRKNAAGKTGFAAV